MSATAKSPSNGGAAGGATPDQLREERKQKLMHSTNKVTAGLYPHSMAAAVHNHNQSPVRLFQSTNDSAA
jgi:hypothetical protein